VHNRRTGKISTRDKNRISEIRLHLTSNGSVRIAPLKNIRDCFCSRYSLLVRNDQRFRAIRSSIKLIIARERSADISRCVGILLRFSCDPSAMGIHLFSNMLTPARIIVEMNHLSIAQSPRFLVAIFLRQTLLLTTAQRVGVHQCESCPFLHV